MFTGIFQTAVALFAAVAFYITDTWLLQKYDRQREDGQSGRNWVNIIASLVAVVCLLVQPIAWPSLGVRIQARWALGFQLLGAALVLGAAGLNLWARIHLGVFFAQRSEVQAGHGLVDSGPYAYVRHPIFLAYYMTTIGLLLVNPSPIMVALAVSAFWYFSDQARQDERLLCQHLPAYAAYVDRVPRYVPRLRRASRDRRARPAAERLASE